MLTFVQLHGLGTEQITVRVDALDAAVMNDEATRAKVLDVPGADSESPGLWRGGPVGEGDGSHESCDEHTHDSAPPRLAEFAGGLRTACVYLVS